MAHTSVRRCWFFFRVIRCQISFRCCTRRLSLVTRLRYLVMCTLKRKNHHGNNARRRAKAVRKCSSFKFVIKLSNIYWVNLQRVVNYFKVILEYLCLRPQWHSLFEEERGSERNRQHERNIFD